MTAPAAVTPASAYQRLLLQTRARGFAAGRAELVRITESLGLAIRQLDAIARRSGATTLTGERAVELRRELDTVLRALETRLGATGNLTTRAVVRDVVDAHRQAALALLSDVGRTPAAALASRFATANVNAITAVAARRGGAARTYQTLIRRNMLEAAPALDRLIQAGIARGASIDDLTRGIANLLRGARPEAPDLRLPRLGGLSSIESDARRIARSETMNALREGTRYGMMAGGMVAAAQWVTSGNHQGEDVCDELAEADDYDFGPGFYPLEEWPFAPHPNCFPPETVVQGSVRTAMRAQYAGDLIEIRTLGGQQLSITPNHPILTRHGFRAAQTLRQGDSVLCDYGRIDATAGPRTEYPQYGPSTIQDVFGALAESSPIASTQRSAGYLHGDAIRGEGDIDIVGTDGKLLTDGHMPRTEGMCDDIFVGAATQEAIVRHLGALDLDVEGIGLTAPGFVRLAYETSGIATGGLKSLPEQAARFGAATDANALQGEPAGQNPAADARLIAQLFDRGAGLIEFDEVVEIRYRQFRGHVYDLSTVGGYIIANNIVCSNCACYQGAVIFKPVREWD